MDLTNARDLSELLRRHGIAARKGLGQHFLISSKVVGKIVGQFEDLQGVLEIGPGPGVLTAPLSRSHKVVALELDREMLPVLAESAPLATVIAEDALNCDLKRHLCSLPEPRGIVSNLPYYITGPLIARIAEQRPFFRRAVLMMQAEVGVRILAPARNSDRGAVSVMLQQQFAITRLCNVPRGAFSPPPNVDSVVLKLEPLSVETPTNFEQVVRCGFSQPRKTLANNLASGGFDKAQVHAAIAQLGLGDSVRAHMLEQEQWACLSAGLKRPL